MLVWFLSFLSQQKLQSQDSHPLRQRWRAFWKQYVSGRLPQGRIVPPPMNYLRCLLDTCWMWFYFIRRRHENMSPFGGSWVNINYKRIASWAVPIETLPSEYSGNSGISSWESEHWFYRPQVRNSGDGQKMLEIGWEFWPNMLVRFTGTKCLIINWEYFPVWLLNFSQCLIIHWEWSETAGNSLGNLTNYANEMFRHNMSHQTLGIFPRLSKCKYWECMQDSYHISAFPSTCDHTLGILAKYKCWYCR